MAIVITHTHTQLLRLTDNVVFFSQNLLLFVHGSHMSYVKVEFKYSAIIVELNGVQ